MESLKRRTERGPQINGIKKNDGYHLMYLEASKDNKNVNFSGKLYIKDNNGEKIFYESNRLLTYAYDINGQVGLVKYGFGNKYDLRSFIK